jgi:hypothetical protein
MAQSLFGLTPEQIQEARRMQQQQAINQQAQSFGMFGPLYAAGRGMAQQGIGALAQGLFPDAQQDPMLQQATALQGLRQQYAGVDLSDPNNLLKLAADLSGVGAVEQAMQVAQQARSIAPKSPFSSIDQSKFTPESIQKFITAGGKDSDRVVLDPIEKKDSIKPTPTFQQEAGGLGIPLQPTLDLYTPEQIAQVNDALKAKDMEKARASASRLDARLNFDNPSDRVKAVSEINSNLKPYSEPVVQTTRAIQLAINKTSPFAQKGFETAVGDIFGGQVRAQAEIERLRNSGNLGERLTNTLSLFLSGNIGRATRDDQLEVLMSLYELNRNQYDDFVQPYRAAVGEKADAIAPLAKDRFKLPKLQPGKQYIPMSVVVANELKKGESFESGGQTYVYNGDGTISPVKGQ